VYLKILFTIKHDASPARRIRDVHELQFGRQFVTEPLGRCRHASDGQHTKSQGRDCKMLQLRRIDSGGIRVPCCPGLSEFALATAVSQPCSASTAQLVSCDAPKMVATMTCRNLAEAAALDRRQVSARTASVRTLFRESNARLELQRETARGCCRRPPSHHHQESRCWPE